MADSSFIATIYTKVTKVFVDNRSEERRVGKEGRSWGAREE